MKKVSVVIGGVGIWSLVYGAHNLQITPTEFFANESFEVSFEFEQQGVEAIGKIYLDMNENGVLDEGTDKLLYILELQDGSCLDEDETSDGKYKEKFLPLLSSGKFILHVEDNNVSDAKAITVKSIESSYSVSGKVTTPANTKGIYVCLFRITNYDPLQYEFSYGDFTDEGGNYKIGVTEKEANIQWNIAIMDIGEIASDYWSNNLQTDTITINGAKTKDVAMETGTSIPVSGTIKSNTGGNLPHSPLLLLGAAHATMGVIDNLRIRVARAGADGSYSVRLPPFGMVGIYFSGTMAFLRQFYGKYMAPASKKKEFIMSPPSSVSIDLLAYEVNSKISGKVLINNQPYDGCIVTAKAQNVGTSMGVTCKDGEYEVGVNNEVSTYTIRVDPRSIPEGAVVNPQSKEASPGETGVDFTVGVEEESIEFEGLSITISTNPVKGEIVFTIPYRKSDVGELYLYDIAGNCVATIEGKAKGPKETEFKVNRKMAVGVYFYSITIGKVRVQGKVIKIR
jgi:hypothetical protein